MKYKLQTTLSTLALMVSCNVFAADVTTATSVSGTPSVNAPSTSSASQNKMSAVVEEFRVYLFGKDKDADLNPILIHRNMTAHGMLGADIVSPNGVKVGSVKDFIVDQNGKAILIVISDGGLLGIGNKVAAFDYDKVVSQKTDGKVVMGLSQDMINHASNFSYDPKDWAKASVIPPGSISVDQLLKGDIDDASGKKVGSIENIYFRNGDVSQVIVGFDKTLNMGGKLAALNYNDLQLIKKDAPSNDLNLQLSGPQSLQFENFKKSVVN